MQICKYTKEEEKKRLPYRTLSLFFIFFSRLRKFPDSRKEKGEAALSVWWFIISIFI